jgi:pantetheine-phosphate adenylyltransferase/8-oxo-dGTP diphosphatase
MMKKAVYAGSFDPVTNGHLWVLQEGARLFDEVVFAVGVNPKKTPTFSLDDRLAMLRSISGACSNVTVDSFEDQYLVNYARSIDAQYILRGLRNAQDFAEEKRMSIFNHDICPDIQTIPLITPQKTEIISSSAVKGLVGPKGWESAVRRYVPTIVYARLLDKFEGGKHRWEDHWQKHWSLVRHVGDSRQAFDSLRSMYEGRGYHSLVHLLDMHDELDAVLPLAENPSAMRFAIWYHDVEQGEDAESRSADFAECQLGMKASEDLMDDIRERIMGTDHFSGNAPDTPDCRLIADIDLASLAADPDIFDENSRLVLEEYYDQISSEEEFCLRRADILQTFQDRDRIYKTDHFHEKYEARARANLTRAIGDLRERRTLLP